MFFSPFPAWKKYSLQGNSDVSRLVCLWFACRLCRICEQWFLRWYLGWLSYGKIWVKQDLAGYDLFLAELAGVNTESAWSQCFLLVWDAAETHGCFLCGNTDKSSYRGGKVPAWSMRQFTDFITGTLYGFVIYVCAGVNMSISHLLSGSWCNKLLYKVANTSMYGNVICLIVMDVGRSRHQNESTHRAAPSSHVSYVARPFFSKLCHPPTPALRVWWMAEGVRRGRTWGRGGGGEP